AIRGQVVGSDVPGVPGIEVGLRGMAFIETVLASHQGAAKWTPLNCSPDAEQRRHE
ncbi:gfo/Idh/MocA family oxidoreductase, partial [Pseudomonas syringae]|nr:gfo/Idh/MocA family oxidoreductase [Pseudomonas syringae]